MLEKHMVVASDAQIRRSGEKYLMGFGRCDEDFKRLVYSATPHPLFYPDVIEVYDVFGLMRLRLYECSNDGTLREIETA